MNSFLEDINNKILLFDGAMGTEIQQYQPKQNDYLDNKEGFNDSLNFTRPQWIKDIHKKYINSNWKNLESDIKL